jgi:hypothetical protein
MSHTSHSSASANHVENGRPHAVDRTVDWSGYPALFQRVGPATPPAKTVGTPIESTVAPGRMGGVREAFLGFCQAALFAPGATPHADRPSETLAANRALAAAETFGFTRDEIRRLGCGLYAGPAAVREDLRSVGFVDAEIDAARLASDETGRPRAELTGCLIVPLTDETGRLCDFLFLTVGESGRAFCGYRFLEGPAKSKIVAYGLQVALSRPTGRESLVLVDDVLEALLLQCRGLHQVAAVGTGGQDFSPRRWEELARLGVVTVTLAFRRDDRHAGSVRDVLVNALRARTAPQVFVANPYPGGERSAADVLRRFGKDTCAAAIASRTLAFHDKDFGAESRLRAAVEEAPMPCVAPQPLVEPHHWSAFRKHLADLAAALPIEDRVVAEQMIGAVEAALAARDYRRAAWLIDGGMRCWPWDTMFSPAPGTGWASEGRSPSVASASAVLDRLVKSPQPSEIPTHLAGFAGRETPAAVEWLIHASPRARLALLCERLIDACERRPEQAFVVACCEHSERQVVLALVAQLASRLSDGPGLAIEDVRSRLAGQEPPGGYRDKPWLADEAADRLRVWSSRLNFVTCPATPAGQAAVEQVIETARARSVVGGIYFDALPTWNWYGETNGVNWLTDLAARCAGPIVAAAPAAPMRSASVWPVVPACWPLPQTEGGRAVLVALRDWLRRERDVI